MKVDPQMLRDHASRLTTGPATKVVMAADAANTVRLGDEDAYGIIFAQIIPPVLGLFLDDAAAALASAGELGQGFATAVADSAQRHQDADQEVADLFSALLKELDESS